MTTQTAASQVYSRKWRPSRFTSLVGQEHISTTLRRAISQDRVANAYLFCGPRGTGKTSTARVMAKAVNCLDPQDGDPCDQCRICVSANEGRAPDIIELDAASNRGIDEIRNIRERANYAPVEGKRKSYILDEAHMLTDQASNAFLKTLEEPPRNVIFFLCTTEAESILPTIMSRCQRYDFRRIPTSEVMQRLEEIARTEGISTDTAALTTISQKSSGSLRDAENLLEQLSISGRGAITIEQVESLLGTDSSGRSTSLALALLAGDAPSALDEVEKASWEGADIRQLHRNTGELLRAAMLITWGARELPDLPGNAVEKLEEALRDIPRERAADAARIWGDTQVRRDEQSALPIELAAVEICCLRNVPAIPWQPNMSPEPVARATQPEPAPPPEPEPQPRAVLQNDGQPPAGGFKYCWNQALEELKRHQGVKFNLGALLRDAISADIRMKDGYLILPFASRPTLERMRIEMQNESTQELVAGILEKHMGGRPQVMLIQQGEARAMEEKSQALEEETSPLVRAAIALGARIIRTGETENLKTLES